MHKVHVLHAEHFSNPGLVVGVYASREGAVKEAIELVNIMLKDNGDDPIATADSWEADLGALQEEHGAQYCYVEIDEKEVKP